MTGQHFLNRQFTLFYPIWLFWPAVVDWYFATEGDSSSGGRHSPSPGTRAHGSRTAKQFWRGGQSPAILQIDHKASYFKRKESGLRFFCESTWWHTGSFSYYWSGFNPAHPDVPQWRLFSKCFRTIRALKSESISASPCCPRAAPFWYVVSLSLCSVCVGI